MSLTQFSMVEELASLVKDNIPSKYLILAVEDALVKFLHDDISLDAVLDLEPMNSYNRLLVHRLADIFGFTHQSVGRRRQTLSSGVLPRDINVGEVMHSFLKPGILVSDFLLRSGESEPPMIFDVLRRKEVTLGQSIEGVGGCSLEERKATYFAARERIFSGDSMKRPQKDPAVAHLMITRALGQPNNKVIKHDLKEYGQTVKTHNSLETEPLSAKHPKINKASEFKVTKQTLTEGGGSTRSNANNSLRKEHIGAAKRLFANALGVNPRDVKSTETKKTNC